MTPAFRSVSRGGAAIEFLLCLPLLLLAFPVIDLARVVQANMILTNMAREGASLAARTARSEQAIMQALAATAPPLQMSANGMIRITRILARRDHGVLRNVVLSQHRWTGGAYHPPGGVWRCGSGGTWWDAQGNCAGLQQGAAAPEVPLMRNELREGDVVYLVESFYRFPLLFGGLDLGGGLMLPRFESDLHAYTLL